MKIINWILKQINKIYHTGFFYYNSKAQISENEKLKMLEKYFPNTNFKEKFLACDNIVFLLEEDLLLKINEFEKFKELNRETFNRYKNKQENYKKEMLIRELSGVIDE